MSNRMLNLAEAISKPDGFQEAMAGQEVIEVSVPASTAASLYEKVRTSIDYQEEHLLRRNAILRILKRLLGSDIPLENIAQTLLQELVWAKYLPNEEVPVDSVEGLQGIIIKYEPLLRATDDLGNKKDWAFFWILDVLSTELEYAIAPPVADEALVSYMYEEMKQRTLWDADFPLAVEDRDLLLYVAIHKTLLKSNLATLRFRVFTLYYPDWPGETSEKYAEHLAQNLDTILETVESKITHPVTMKLYYMLRRRSGPFHVLRNIIESQPDDFAKLLEDPVLLDKAVSRELKKRTKKFKVKLRRTVIRSVIFLLITKMFLALILELPYDIFIVKATSMMPLFVNILFHPLFLAFISLTITIPERKNMKDHRSAIRALLVGTDQEDLNIHMKRQTFSAWSKIFTVVYTLMFIFTYGLIAYLLYRFEFNWLSISLFLFFFSLVTFFGIRIRTSTKDIVLSSSRTSLIGTMFDFFMLPLVRAGRWLSLKVSKVNVFIYFFDFIIEAPLKVAIRFFESWVSFVREKKDEI